MVEKAQHNNLIDMLKQLIRDDEELMVQMKRTIAVVDKNLERKHQSDAAERSKSSRDKR